MPLPAPVDDPTTMDSKSPIPWALEIQFGLSKSPKSPLGHGSPFEEHSLHLAEKLREKLRHPRQIVERHAGWIEVESGTEGTSFTVWLPAPPAG